MAKLKIEINSVENLRDLLQESYRLADEQMIQAQNEMNKLANSTKLQEETMDSKAKYAKSMNDYLSIKDKAISKKLEIAKLLSELYKFNGDIGNETIKQEIGTFDIESIKNMLDNEVSNPNKTEYIKLKK